MTSDLARVTYDPSRHYQGVVAQQGRVSLEADWNEAQAISREQTETRTLDLVGPAASPDHGYRIEPVVTDDGSATGDLWIRRGTAYVGGQRVSLSSDVCYSSQPDWRDYAGDPLWLDPAIPDEPHELIYLMLREQEVSAVEDPALRDVALGGPDTSQRLRLLQRVVRYPTTAPSWEDAWEQLIGERWDASGFRLEKRSRRLEACARLQVAGTPAEGQEQPADQGTYLGPNNQLIRVQVSRIDDDGTPFLVWGYDNASFMYRLSSVSPGPERGTTALELATAPVDAYHQPAEKQAVEVLRGAASLTREDLIAAATGQVAVVTRAYDPDTCTVVIRTTLPPEYDPARNRLFLRVWEEEFKCKPGEDHELGHTGIRVRLTVPEDAPPGRFAAGACWMVAVRPAVGPGSVGVVYPHRILDAPQPPDGPRLWLTPLAFVRWHPRAPAAEDCLPRFEHLASRERSGGSCTVRIGPQDVGGGWVLQDAIDAHASRDHATTICLEPGSYALRWPLRIGPQHGRLTLRAERHGVVLRAEEETAPRFALGLIAAEDSDGLCLQDLEFLPAQVPFALGQDVYFHLPERARDLLAAHRHRRIAIGVHAIRCANLSIEGCRFVVPPPASSPVDGQAAGGPHAGTPASRASEDLFAVAILGTQTVSGLRVVRCTFTVSEPLEHARRHGGTSQGIDRRDHVALGFAQVPSATAAPHAEPEPADPPAVSEQAAPREADLGESAPGSSQGGKPHGSASLPLLEDAVFEDNLFERLTAPAVAIGQLGALRIERNTVRECHAGFWLITQQASHVLTFLDRLVNPADDAYRDLVNAHLTALAEPLLFHTTVMARTLPDEIADDSDASLEPRRLELPSEADERQASELHHQLSTPDTEPEPAPGPAQQESWRRKFVETFGRVRGIRRQPEAIAVPPEAALRCLLNLSGNTADTSTAPALVVLDTAPDSAASLILTGNHLRNHLRTGAGACLYLLRTCTAAANIIINEESEHRSAASVIVQPRRHQGRAETVITGNVLTGRAYLPSRPGNLPSWHGLNSVTPPWSGPGPGS